MVGNKDYFTLLYNPDPDPDPDPGKFFSSIKKFA